MNCTVGGTNSGMAWSHSSSVPASSATLLVTNYVYNGAGWLQDTIDPMGIDDRTNYDNLGRVTQTIQDYTNGTETTESNISTEYGYDGNNNVTYVQADEPGGTHQKTAYVYGVTTAAGDGINSNDVLSAVQHPDPTSGNPSSSQQDSYKVDALGEVVQATDRNGNVHQYTYDVLGRITSDAVTTLGTGVDGTVRRIQYAYDSQGNNYLITSYNAASGGSIVNQVQDVYNGLGQLTGEYQSHSGAVVQGTTPEVQYAYNEMSNGENNSRLVSMTYPNGFVLTYNYNSGLDDSISRLSSISNAGTTLESYKYLGLSTVVEFDHPQTNINLTYIKQSGDTQYNSDGGDQYTGLDRFGRVIDQFWINTSTSTTVDRYQYGYDQDSDVLWRQNVVNTAMGELYTYDNLNQLTTFARGTLNANKNGISGTPSRTQNFTPDALGNFTNVTTNGTAQTRSANQQNEYTSISGEGTITYDANGNMTADGTGNTYVYDAWNRLVTIKNGSTTLASYSYDGLNRLIQVTESGTTTDLYLSSADQVLAEYQGGTATAYNIWSPVYVNALLFRDVGNGHMYTRYYVLHDANWNVTALVTISQGVVERYAYDPYGAVTVMSPTWVVEQQSAYNVPYGFQSMRYDWTVSENFADNRVYSPSLMRWLQTDPMGLSEGNNDYAFVDNGPTDVVDPSGLAPNAFDRWMARMTGAATPWAYVSPIIQHPEAITVSNLASGANYGSAVMLNEMSFGKMPGAPAYIDKHKNEYSPELTGVVQGMGTVTRESLLAAGTAGTGNIVQSGRAAGYSARTIQAARAAQAAATAREGYQTYEGAKATVEAYQKGDTAGVLLNGAGTLLSGTGAYCGARGLLQTRFPNSKNVAIVDKTGSKLGEFDRIQAGKFIEEKSAAGIGRINPRTGKPFPGSSASEWAKRNIFEKTKVRVENLRKAVGTVPEEGGSRAVPALSDIQGIRTIEFEIASLTPELEAAVEAELANLRTAFPGWTFKLAK